MQPVFFAVLRKLCLLPASLAVLLLMAPHPARADADQGRLLPRGHDKYSIWQQDFLRVKFMRKGKEAVPAADVNNNGCPDLVEDVAAQILATHHIFCDLAGFPSPLDSPRYRGVRYLYVVLRDSSAIGNLEGVAFDEISRQRDPLGATPAVPDKALPRIPVLTIGINKDLDPKKNLTPAHEYFHQIQNGMTHFKNPWFYEGMAVWAESALGGGRNQNAAPPASGEELLAEFGKNPAYREKTFKSSYKAHELIWEPLAGLCSGADIVFSEPDYLRQAFVYTDGSPVIQSARLRGGRLMLRVLERLGKVERIPFTSFNYGSWTEPNQRHWNNNAFIANELLKAVQDICPDQGPPPGGTARQ